MSAIASRGIRLPFLLVLSVLCPLSPLAPACSARAPSPGSWGSELPATVAPFLGDWRFVSSGMLGGASQGSEGQPNRMRISSREDQICFALFAPEGTVLHDLCLPLGKSESGGLTWSTGLTEDGIRVHSIEGDPEAFAAENLLIYRIVSPDDSLLIESWTRMHRMGIVEDGWHSRGYSVYERMGETSSP